MYAPLLIGAIWLKGPILLSEIWWIGVALASYAAAITAGLPAPMGEQGHGVLWRQSFHD